MLDLETLQILIAFSEEKTLSKTAEAINVSQPSLSRSMKKLEDELQVSLFTRSKNRLELNKTGTLAVGHAKMVLAEVDRMVTSVQLFDRKSRNVRIGTVAPTPLWALIPNCSVAFPHMSVDTEIQEEKALYRGLDKGDYRLVVVHNKPEDSDNYNYFLYNHENILLCVPPDHPLAEKEEVSVADFNGETMLVVSNIGFWEKIFRDNLPDSHFIYQSERSEVGELMKHSDLLCFSSDLQIQTLGAPGGDTTRKLLPITDDFMHASYYLVYKRSEERNLRPLLRLIQPLDVDEDEIYAMGGA